jgi:hypothetical protein
MTKNREKENFLKVNGASRSHLPIVISKQLNLFNLGKISDLMSNVKNVIYDNRVKPS